MNFEKFSKGQAALLRHVERRNIQYINENVSLDYSDRNIQFSPDRDVSSVKYWHDTLREIHVTRRSGANATVDLAGFTVSLPPELREAKKEEQQEFFQDTYDFIKERYFDGDDRFIVSAVAHYDEITEDGNCTPHLHVLLIPAVQSERHAEGWKCACKSFVTRDDLKSWHSDYSDYLTERGWNVSVVSDRPGGTKYYSMDYFKKHRREILNERQRELSRSEEIEVNSSRWGLSSDEERKW